MKQIMDRSAVVIFSDELREARENALRDSEAFDGIVHVVERLGSFLRGKITHLEEIPGQRPDLHVPFSLLYKLVREARNDALHQGAFARRLTGHAIELSLVLEDALRRSLESPVVGDYMVRGSRRVGVLSQPSTIRKNIFLGVEECNRLFSSIDSRA